MRNRIKNICVPPASVAAFYYEPNRPLADIGVSRSGEHKCLQVDVDLQRVLMFQIETCVDGGDYIAARYISNGRMLSDDVRHLAFVELEGGHESIIAQILAVLFHDLRCAHASEKRFLFRVWLRNDSFEFSVDMNGTISPPRPVAEATP